MNDPVDTFFLEKRSQRLDVAVIHVRFNPVSRDWFAGWSNNTNDFMIIFKQPSDQMLANEAGRAADQKFHVVCLNVNGVSNCSNVGKALSRSETVGSLMLQDNPNES